MTDENQNKINQHNQIPRSRAEQRKLRQKPEGKVAHKNQMWVQIRLIPIWLRVVLVLLLLLGAAIVGAMIGYGYIGDGEPKDILKKETWTHILDIIKGIES